MDTAQLSDEELAEIFAKKIASRLRIGHRWREVYAAAWKGVLRAKKAGVVSSSGLYRGAWFDVVEQLRSETGLRRVAKTVRFVDLPDYNHNQLVYMKDARRENHVTDHRTLESDTLPSRLLKYWCETRCLRVGIPIRYRVVAYLYTVECLTMDEVGKLLGMSEARVSYIVKDFKSKVEDNYEQENGRDQWGVGQGDSRKEEGGIVGKEVEHAGDATERDTDCSGTSGRGGCSDEDTVIENGGPVTGTTGDERGVGVGGQQEADLPVRVGEGGLRTEGQEPQPHDRGEKTGQVPADTQTVVRVVNRRSVETVESCMPTGVDLKAKALRASMLDSIGSCDVQDVIQVVLKKAKKGDLTAAKILLGLIGAK